MHRCILLQVQWQYSKKSLHDSSNTMWSMDEWNARDGWFSAWRFKKEHPYVKKIYGTSDNNGSYHGNFNAETLYKICKSKGVNLVRYDYNEPCCGKDQCDRESAVAKNLIRSFVDTGNDVISANDIFKALQFAKGMKNIQGTSRQQKFDLSYSKFSPDFNECSPTF